MEADLHSGPITKALAANAAELAHVVPLEKYGIPPEVPATVKAGVVVGVATEIMPPVKPTEVTVPTLPLAQDKTPLAFVDKN